MQTETKSQSLPDPTDRCGRDVTPELVRTKTQELGFHAPVPVSQ